VFLFVVPGSEIVTSQVIGELGPASQNKRITVTYMRSPEMSVLIGRS
jgi:hypothetical protein